MPGPQAFHPVVVAAVVVVIAPFFAVIIVATRQGSLDGSGGSLDVSLDGSDDSLAARRGLFSCSLGGSMALMQSDRCFWCNHVRVSTCLLVMGVGRPRHRSMLPNAEVAPFLQSPSRRSTIGPCRVPSQLPVIVMKTDGNKTYKHLIKGKEST